MITDQLILANKQFAVALLVLIFVLQDGVLVAATIFPAFQLVDRLSYVLTEKSTDFVRIWFDVAVSTKRMQVNPQYKTYTCT